MTSEITNIAVRMQLQQKVSGTCPCEVLVLCIYTWLYRISWFVLSQLHWCIHLLKFLRILTSV